MQSCAVAGLNSPINGSREVSSTFVEKVLTITCNIVDCLLNDQGPVFVIKMQKYASPLVSRGP